MESEVTKAILAWAGGSSAVVGALVKWLSKVQENRILENEKAEHAKELENEKAKHAKELEELKFEHNKAILELQRLGNTQFELTDAIWPPLRNLNAAADVLWENISIEALERFQSSFEEFENALTQAEISLPDSDLQTLNEMMDAFKRYGLNKLLLKEQREQGVAMEHLQKFVDENREYKTKFDELVKKTAARFRKLRGVSE